MTSGESFFMPLLLLLRRARLRHFSFCLLLAQPLERRRRRLDVELLRLGVALLDREPREEDEARPRLEAAQELRERLQVDLADLDVDVVLGIAAPRGRR